MSSPQPFLSSAYLFCNFRVSCSVSTEPELQSLHFRHTLSGPAAAMDGAMDIEVALLTYLYVVLIQALADSQPS
jgi:hypothetical protein